MADEPQSLGFGALEGMSCRLPSGPIPPRTWGTLSPKSPGLLAACPIVRTPSAQSDRVPLEIYTRENLGRLTTDVRWYRKKAMVEGENPPVGILLCAQKDHTPVEYALSGTDNSLFVSKYLLELPSKEEMQRFLEARMREVGDG